MGKRRKSAKTGDKAIYGSRGNDDNKVGKADDDDDDPTHDKVDRFHNERDENFMRLDDDPVNNDSEEDDGISGNRHVMDLGGGGDDSSTEEDEDSSEDEKGQANPQDDDFAAKSGQEDSSSDDDSDSDEDDGDEDEHGLSDPRNWGKKKSLYYHGDTADLEIGQDEDDAFVEEEAAREVQHSRFEDMDEDDFAISGDEGDGDDDLEKPQEELKATRDTSKLSSKEKRKLIQKQHPELLPVVSHFSDVVKELKDRTRVATTVLTQDENSAETIGATRQGQEYLLTKSLLQNSIALNTVMYLLLKSDNELENSSRDDTTKDSSAFQSHPVMAQLTKCHSMIQKFEDRIESKTKGIVVQVDNLVQAAALMSSEQVVSEDDSDDDEKEDHDSNEKETQELTETASGSEDDEADEADDDMEMVNELTKKQEAAKKSQSVLHEARFGLRPHEVKTSKKSTKKKRADTSDFGDIDGDDEKVASKSFASAINAIEQRSATESRKRRQAPSTEELFDPEVDDELAQGLKMMEEEMGKLDDNEEDDGGDIMDDEIMDSQSAEPLGFYEAVAKKSKNKKSFKKSLYQVAPKFPTTDGVVDGERAISRAILKNRGLVAHKAKINRNPRVKKREQYRKALIRRKGAIREVRTDEGHKYAGEETGIKSGISRSRKLVS